MCKILKNTIIILFVFSIFSICLASEYEFINNETGYKAIIEDDEGLLTKEECEQLFTQIQNLTQFGNIAFKSTRSGLKSTKKYVAGYYHSKFKNQSGTVFVIDMYYREIYIFSDGNNYNIITSGRAKIITDNVYLYATNGKYYECAQQAFEQVETLLKGGKILAPMKYACNILVAFVLSLMLNSIFLGKYVSKNKIKYENMNAKGLRSFHIKNIEMEKGRLEKTYISDSGSYSGGGSSHSSSRGSSHSSSGGRSSGGGGGHRF